MKKEFEQMDSIDMELERLKKENEKLTGELSNCRALNELYISSIQELTTKIEAIKLLLK